MSRREAIISGVLLGVMCFVIFGVVMARRSPFSDPPTGHGAYESDLIFNSTDGDSSESTLGGFVDEAVEFIESVRGRPLNRLA